MDHLPELFPHELARMDMRHFVKVLQSHRERLLAVFKAEGIESISHQFSQFLLAIRQYLQFKDSVVGEADTFKIFQECWEKTQSLFPLLQELCSGLVAAFHNTETVKLEFPIIG